MMAVTDETAAVGSKPADVVGEQLARQLVEQARTRGVDLVGQHVPLGCNGRAGADAIV
jgi:hypothetical protein